MHLLALLMLALAIAGIAYTLAGAALAGRIRAAPFDAPAHAMPASILKPLHGAEPRLAENLATFVAQRYPAPIQLICGVADPADPALAAAEALADRNGTVEIVAEQRRHGSNAKISNLINMAAHARHPLIVLSDSDIAVAPDHLARVAAALAAPGVGAVTCLYIGRGDAGFWSRIAACGINWQFLPSVLVGLATGRAQPCMGSTIALSRATLDEIGGFERFADMLADDHAIGAAVRARGLKVAIPQMVVTHGCAEPSLTALLRHELRWAVTIRGLDRLGHAGSIVTHPLPLALAALALGAPGGLVTLVAALGARLLLAARIERSAGHRRAPLHLLPLRDMLSFGVFLASFGARSIDWRGARHAVRDNGRLLEAQR